MVQKHASVPHPVACSNASEKLAETLQIRVAGIYQRPELIGLLLRYTWRPQYDVRLQQHSLEERQALYELLSWQAVQILLICRCQLQRRL